MKNETEDIKGRMKEEMKESRIYHPILSGKDEDKVRNTGEKSKQPKYKEIKEINGNKVICLNDACTEYRYYEDSGNLEMVPREKCELKYKPEDWVGFKDELLNLTTQMLQKKGKQRIVFEKE